MTAPHDTPSREQLLYWLHEAAEIEHHLMCCYLYAAFSLKRGDPAGSYTGDQVRVRHAAALNDKVPPSNPLLRLRPSPRSQDSGFRVPARQSA